MEGVVTTDTKVMTTPSIFPNDILIRKFRIDDDLPENQRQYVLKEGVKRPSAAIFSFPSKFEEDKDNSLSVYVEDFIDRLNIPVELLLETFTRKSAGKYGASNFSVALLDEYFPNLMEVKYDYDGKDPILTRGLCHVLISFKDGTKDAYTTNRREWSINRNKFLDAIDVADTSSFRLS